MSKKKQNKKLFEEPQGTQAEENVAETEATTENLEVSSDLAEGVSVSITYEVNPEKPDTPATIMDAEIEVEEQDRKLEAVKAFAELWESLPHHNYMTDAQARQVHRLWQAVTGRTDYYTNCSVCTINHIKYLKKIARGYGIEIR